MSFFIKGAGNDEAKTSFPEDRDLSLCVYCGDPSTDRDHLIPCSWEGHRSYDKPECLVKSCKWCNSLLGDVPLFSVPARAYYLIGQYERKFKRVLQRSYHSEKDILCTRNNVKLLLKTSNEEKRWIELKLQNLDRAYNGFSPLPILCIRDIVKHGLRFYPSRPKYCALCLDNQTCVTNITRLKAITGIRKFRLMQLRETGQHFADLEGLRWTFVYGENFRRKKALAVENDQAAPI
jgi:hypothetical protein